MQYSQITITVEGASSAQRMVRRINRVRGYMEARGFRVGRGTWVNGTETLPTVDIDRLDRKEINGAWECYLSGDSRSEVWAMIDAAREALKCFAPNDAVERLRGGVQRQSPPPTTL